MAVEAASKPHLAERHLDSARSRWDEGAIPRHKRIGRELVCGEPVCSRGGRLGGPAGPRPAGTYELHLQLSASDGDSPLGDVEVASANLEVVVPEMPDGRLSIFGAVMDNNLEVARRMTEEAEIGWPQIAPPPAIKDAMLNELGEVGLPVSVLGQTGTEPLRNLRGEAVLRPVDEVLGRTPADE